MDSAAMEDLHALDLGDVIAGAVHDIKNSLGIVLGAVDDIVAEIEPDAGPQRDALYRLRYEGRRLNANLIQLLSLYRIKNGRYAPNITAHEVRECLEDCCHENEQLLAIRKIRIDLQCPDTLDGYFDRDLVMGVINTVINNAYRYARSRVVLSADQQPGYLRICVADDGAGYPQDMLDAREQRAISFSRGGTGLGIYFAALVASMHKNKNRRGFIATDNSGIDGGACFSIYLP